MDFEDISIYRYTTPDKYEPEVWETEMSYEDVVKYAYFQDKKEGD